MSEGQVEANGAAVAEVVREQETRPSGPGAQDGVEDGGLSPREQVAMAIARREGRVTRAMLMAAAGIRKDPAYKVLKRLVAKGLLVKEGETGCGAGYVHTG